MGATPISKSENVSLGRVRCDFMSMEDFVDICDNWLKTTSFHHVVTLNPEMVMVAERDEKFFKAIKMADLRVPDGAGLVWARWYLRSQYWPLWPSLFSFLFQTVERVTGVDAVKELARLCCEQNKGIYLLGGTKQQVEKTAQLLLKRFPKLRIATAPEHDYNLQGPKDIVEDIRRNSPAVLFVAYGAPKQTIWIENMRKQLAGVSIVVGVGGAFAMLSEDLPRAPYFLRQINLEWLWRLYLEPKRVNRIWQATIKFPLLMRRYKSEIK
jgi:N-acetylglucosaminyldiphosphoundecaprenol N-acetyl-beta-D-mannosaminyltransferase